MQCVSFSFRVGRRRWAFWPEALPELLTIMKDPRDPQWVANRNKERCPSENLSHPYMVPSREVGEKVPLGDRLG